ncbi:MAG: sensor histidine kinase, partial [Eubacteriales bacterium]|nr:sensor histidine kinase [Eubacteriales bacterium]
MKLRSKLYLSFCIMIILPVALCACAVYMIFCLQKESISETYNVDGNVVLENLYSPITIYGRMTDNIYEELKQQAYSNPEMFNDSEYIEQVEGSLSECLSSLVIRKNGVIMYSSVNDISAGELKAMLPDYDY